MLKMKFAAGLAAASLIAGAALAQTTAPTQPAGAGQIMTQMPQDLMRGSRLMGVDVYGADNQKIGDIDEILMDRQGKVHGIVVGVGGFLGIGQKDVAIPFDQVQWMSTQEVQAMAGQGATTTGTVTSPAAPTAGGPATTGSTGAAGTAGTGTAAAPAAGDNLPARAVVKMTKADLQNAPAFRYTEDAGRTTAPAGNTSPPPASRPGTAPQQ
jgi:sporulation protein YlmC with PRC-barrel domain